MGDAHAPWIAFPTSSLDVCLNRRVVTSVADSPAAHLRGSWRHVRVYPSGMRVSVVCVVPTAYNVSMVCLTMPTR